ncbi:MAG: hypothetical protein PSV35_06180, partial [bacterium]|nr:hypothetical protein [bacterium]
MTLDAYSADLGEKKTKELSSAIDRLSSEARLSSFAATPINLSQTATTQKSIIVDVRSFEGFTTEKLEINSTEYNKGASATESHLEGMQNNGPELHYEGHVLKDNERIVTQAKMSEGTIRLEQDKTGAVRDRSVGNLSSLELQQAALKQAQMILNNYDPQNGKLIIRGKDVEQ